MQGDSKAQQKQQREQQVEQNKKRPTEQGGYDKRLDGPNRPSV